MTEVLPFLLNLFLNFVEDIALFLFGSCFFDSKFHGKRLFILFFLLLALNVLAFVLANGILAVKLISIAIIMSSWFFVVFRTHIIKCIVVSAFFLAFMTVGDSIFIMLFSLLIENGTQISTQNMYVYYSLCYTAKMVELLGIVILRLVMRKRKERQISSWREWTRPIMFPIMSIIISVLLSQVYAVAADSANIILFCSMVLLLTDILGIVLLNHLEQQQQKLHDYSILQHSMKIEQENVAAWMTAYSNQRKQTHEFQNQLAAIRGLALQGNANEELIQYLDTLFQTDMSNSLFVKTGRTIVDAVLNQKYALAQSKSVQFQVSLDDLSEFALPDDALVVVLSNLIDNAIEASEKVEDIDKRIIKLNMKATPEVNFLYIENYTSTPVIIKNNQVYSTKRGLLEHGYGLKNVFSLLEQHNALYALDYDEENKSFCFSAQIIPLEKPI